jgi:hypothetical protein
MPTIAEIDLHPDKVKGSRPEHVLNECRAFLRECQRQGVKEARIITGLGYHGDGTPRLRQRVENEVLPGFDLEDALLEQNGAVIRVVFRIAQQKQSPRHLSTLEKQRTLQDKAQHEARLGIAWDRLDQAKDALGEGDLKKVRQKVNQIYREFAPQYPECEAGLEGVRKGLLLAETLIRQHDDSLGLDDDGGWSNI